MQKNISVILPVYNEGSQIADLINEIEKHIRQVEFVVINDGSTDNSLEVSKKVILKPGNRIKIVDLARNFGHQTALLAGLHYIREDTELIVVMDADFQDLPSDIPKLIDSLITNDMDCVYGTRKADSGNWIINYATKLFYKLQKSFFKFPIPENAGTFCVFNRRFLSQILEFKEFDIYFPGIRAFIGLRQKGYELTRGKRRDGDSKVGFMGLVNLSLVGLLSFSRIPLRLIFIIGLVTFVVNIFLGLVVFLIKILSITKIPGITTLLILILSFFGMQMMCIGILGEYTGKLYQEVKDRPRFIVKDVHEA